MGRNIICVKDGILRKGGGQVYYLCVKGGILRKGSGQVYYVYARGVILPKGGVQVYYLCVGEGILLKGGGSRNIAPKWGKRSRYMTQAGEKHIDRQREEGMTPH